MGQAVAVSRGQTVAIGAGQAVAASMGQTVAIGVGQAVAASMGQTVAIGAGQAVAVSMGQTVAIGAGQAVVARVGLDEKNNDLRTPFLTPDLLLRFSPPVVGLFLSHRRRLGTVDTEMKVFVC